MRIHHSRPGSGFTRIPNEALRDERLSFAARGHLAYLLSLPDGWKTSADDESRRARKLRAKRGEGRAAMRAVYAELKKAGYMRQVRTAAASGRWATETHVFDRPRTDVPETDVPETRTSVPPAETPEPVDNSAVSPQVDEFSQVAPTYRSPGVGSPDVGSPAHRSAVRSYEDWTTEDWNDEERVGDEVDDWGVRGNHPRTEDQRQGQGQEQPIANSQASSRWPGNDGPDAQHFPLPVTLQSPATDRNARASETDAPANGDDDSAESSPPEAGGASAPLSEPAQIAASDATITRLPARRWDTRTLAAQQVAEARAARKAAERADSQVTP